MINELSIKDSFVFFNETFFGRLVYSIEIWNSMPKTQPLIIYSYSFYSIVINNLLIWFSVGEICPTIIWVNWSGP